MQEKIPLNDQVNHLAHIIENPMDDFSDALVEMQLAIDKVQQTIEEMKLTSNLKKILYNALSTRGMRIIQILNRRIIDNNPVGDYLSNLQSQIRIIEGQIEVLSTHLLLTT